MSIYYVPGLLKALDMDYLVEFHNRPLSMHGFSRELAPFSPLQPPTTWYSGTDRVPAGSLRPLPVITVRPHPLRNHLLTPPTVGKFAPLKIGVIFIKADFT